MQLMFLVLIVLVLIVFFLKERTKNRILRSKLVTLEKSNIESQKRLNKVIKISDSQQLELFNESEKSAKNTARLEIVIKQSDRFQKELLDLNSKLTIAEGEAVSAEKAKDAFLSNMSHEIRTPLNAILGFVKILQRSTHSSKDKEYLNIIENSGQSLIAIINDILDFAKIRSGQFSIDPFEVDITKEMENVAELFSSKVFEKEIDYLTYIDPLLPSTIKIDVVRVKQIVSNYLSNAIKFTPEYGRIELCVGFDASLKRLNVYVKDWYRHTKKEYG